VKLQCKTNDVQYIHIWMVWEWGGESDGAKGEWRDAACNMNSCIPIGIAPSWMSIDFCSLMLYPGCAAMEGLPAGCISVVQQGPEDLH
jgi:hypothetical protein